MVESGYWTCHTGAESCVYWLDNQRVIFNGSNPVDHETTSDGRREWRHAIYIWDLKTGAVTKHADADRASLCYADSYIRYWRTTHDGVVVYAGPIGKEVEVERHSKPPLRRSGGWFARLDCGKTAVLDAPQGSKVALKEGHGFLYLGTLGPPTERREPVVYFPGGGKVRVQLPLARWQLSPPTVLRSDFDDSYLLFGPYRRNEGGGVNACVPAGLEQKAYRLTVDGRVKEMSIPADPRLRCHLSVVGMSRAGLLVEVGGGHATNLDATILYLIRKGVIQEVTRGVTTEHLISPDGCLLALGISSSKDPRKPVAAMDRGHLKVIDFCTRGGN